MYKIEVSKPLSNAIGLGSEAISKANALRRVSQQGASELARQARDMSVARVRHPLGRLGVPKPVHEAQEQFYGRLEAYEAGVIALAREFTDTPEDIETMARVGLKWIEIATDEHRAGMNQDKRAIDYVGDFPFMLDDPVRGGMSHELSQKIVIAMHELLVSQGADMVSQEGPGPNL